MSTEFKPRPKVYVKKSSQGQRNLHHPDLFKGYDKAVSFRIQFTGTDLLIPNFSLHDIEVEIVWKQTHDAEQRVQDAQVYFDLVGFGWSKLESRKAGGMDGHLSIRNGHIIVFEYYHIVTLPVIPITDLVEKLNMVNRWPCVIHGVYDVKTQYLQAEMKWR